LGLPVGHVAPLRVLEELRGRFVEGAGVAEAAAADARAADDGHVLEGRKAEDAAQAEARRPEVAADVPGRLREVLLGEALAALQDGDLVALFGQAQGGNRAPEPGADNNPVVVVLAHQPAKPTCGSGLARLQ